MAEPVTTNVALGAKVTSSHPVASTLEAQFLTDGVTYTLVHPEAGDLGADFWYEIDLGQSYPLDHISLRQRNDRWDNDRFSRVFVDLYELPPSDGKAPVWSALVREDGSYPQPSEVETLKAGSGKGFFKGRYLRISSDSKVPNSPQLAEVEVYARRTPVLVSLAADSVLLEKGKSFVVPPRCEKLSFNLAIPEPGKSPENVLRWRVRGYQEDWRRMSDVSFDLRCPSAGSYLFEAQAAHSDGSWDSTLLSFPIVVQLPFTHTLTFRWLLSGLGLLVGLLLMRGYSRRRIALLEAKAAVSDERTRIARDMHDDVGAQLAQLAILHDVFANEFELSEEAKESIHQLSRVARQAAASLEEVVWTVNPRNDTLAVTAEHIAQFTHEYLTPLKIACRIDAPPEWPPVEVRATVRQELKFVIKEALQNVVKHSQASEVLLTLRYENGEFSIQIADNGCGMGEAPEGAGHHGLNHMKDRMAALGGRFTISDRSPQGTVVTIQISLSL
jgi:signal transduction histidine kinase